MKKILTLTLFICLHSNASPGIVCEDGNYKSIVRVVLNFKLEKATTSYQDKWLPCYVDPYDGFECDYENPRKFTEEIIQAPADLFIASSSFVGQYKFINVSMKRVLTSSPGGWYTVEISETLSNEKLILKINGRVELPKYEFYRGYEYTNEDGQYFSINTLKTSEQNRLYYLKCRGLY